MGIKNLLTKLNYIIKYYILIQFYQKKEENCHTIIFILLDIRGHINNVKIKI